MKKFMSIIILSLTLICFSCSQQPAWQEQYDLGVRYLSNGNYEEAIIAFSAAIEIEPKLAEAYIGRGQAYIGLQDEEGNLELALADYMAVLEFDAENTEAYLGVADVYIRMGDYDKALEILQQGAENIDDQRITDKISELEQGIRVDSDGNYRKTVYFYSALDDSLSEYELMTIDDMVLASDGDPICWTCKFSISDANASTEVVGRKYYVKLINDNEQKNLSKNYYYDDGTLFRHDDIVLDDSGLEIGRTSTFYFDNGNYSGEAKIEYTDIEYNDNGKKISDKCIEDNANSYDRYYYDELGYLERKEEYYNGQMYSYAEYR